MLSFQELHDRLGLQRATDVSFFSEWQNATKTLNDSDEAFLDHLQQRYYNYYNCWVINRRNDFVFSDGSFVRASGIS